MNDDSEKYRELYNLAKEAFGEELNRSYRVDDKASKYLSVVTLLLGIYGSFGERILSSNIPPRNLYDNLILLLGACAIGSLVYAWYTLFQVLRVHEFKKIPIAIDFFENNSLSDVYVVMSQGMKDNLEHNREQGDKKTKLLSSGYSAILISGMFLLGLSGSLVAYRWIYTPPTPTQRSATMKDEEKKPAAHPAVSEKPAKAKIPIKPPAFDTVNEGYDPSMHKKKTINTQKNSE